MKRFDLVSPTLAAGLLLAVAGCASAPPPGSLQALQNDMARRLAVQCYWEHEGERALFGGFAVHSACMRWAESQVRARFPSVRAVPAMSLD
jgi:hypothetical protein